MFWDAVYQHSDQSGANFPLTAMSRGDLTLCNNNKCICSHRDFKVLDGGLTAFTFNVLVCNLLSDLLRHPLLAQAVSAQALGIDSMDANALSIMELGDRR